MTASLIVVRPVRAEDAEDINIVRRQPKVMRFTLSMPSERVAFNRSRIDRLGPDDHMMVAEIDGKVVGVAGLHLHVGKERHWGTVGISVHDDYHGRGAGAALMRALLDLADNFLGLVRVDLQVLADNELAITMYERLGFVHEGRQRKAVYRDGAYVDALMMARIRETP